MLIKNFENKFCYNITNEYSLQLEVVKFLRKTGLLFSCTHTEEMLDNDIKRIESYKCGYTPGIPDLLIFNQNDTFNGLAIELKNPWGSGKLSNDQETVLNQFAEQNWLVLVCNDLVEICNFITLYQHNLIQNS